MLKKFFSIFSSQEISPSLLSFQVIFEALQSELIRYKLHSPGSKILKISEFNLKIAKTQKNVQLAKEANGNEQNSLAIRYYENLKYLFLEPSQQTLTLWYKFWRSVARLCDRIQSKRIRQTAKIPKKLAD